MIQEIKIECILKGGLPISTIWIDGVEQKNLSEIEFKHRWHSRPELKLTW